jgi:general secretion pathway protein C
MSARVTAFVVWALVGATAVLWALRLAARPLPLPAYAVTAANDVLPTGGDLARLLGAPPEPADPQMAAAPALASRIRLVGVMAPPAGRQSDAGLALLAIDGKPARAFRPGASVEGDLVLQSVGLRTAAIGPLKGAALLTLEVPRLPTAATGTLPPPGAVPGLPGAVVAPPPPMLPVIPNAGLPPAIETEDPAQVPMQVPMPVPPPPTQRPRAVQ